MDNTPEILVLLLSLVLTGRTVDSPLPGGGRPVSGQDRVGRGPAEVLNTNADLPGGEPQRYRIGPRAPPPPAEQPLAKRPCG